MLNNEVKTSMFKICYSILNVHASRLP